MAAYYFDTNALIKRHVREPGSTWVRSRTSHAIYLASITAVEVYAAITRRQRGGSLSARQAGAILGHFHRHFSHGYRIVELSPPLLAKARLLARRHGLRAYDGVQLVTAIEANRTFQPTGLGSDTLVPADRELNTAAAVEGLTVEDPNRYSREVEKKSIPDDELRITDDCKA